MDSFFGIGIPELFMIAIIALVVLGPERLPATLREVAKFIKAVRSMFNDLTSQFGDEFKALEDLNPQKLLRELTDDPDKTADALAKSLGTTKAAAATTPKPATPSTTTTPAATTAATSIAATPKSETIAAGNSTSTVTPPASAGAMSTETPAEVKKVVDTPTASSAEPSILPPALASQTATPSIEVNEAKPMMAASVIEGDGPVMEEEVDLSKPTESATERLANSALDTLPEDHAAEMASKKISSEDIEAADIVIVDTSAVDPASTENENIENDNTGTVDADTGDANGSEKAAGEVPVVPTRAYTQSASVNGAHVNGNSKENEA